MIYLITGLMASGKSTVAEILAQRFPKAVHLRGDVFRKMIVAGREEMSEQPSTEALRQLDMRYSLTANAAKEYLKSGFTVVLQDNYYGEKLPYILKLLEPAMVKVIVLCPNAETIQKRDQERNKTGYNGFDVKGLHEAFLKSTERIGLWIDNSNQTPEETVEQIMMNLNQQSSK